LELNADITLDDEGRSAGARTLTPEKRLSSPITIGLISRLLTLTREGLAGTTIRFNNSHTSRNREAVVTEYVRKDIARSFSGIKKPLIQFLRMLDFCLDWPTILMPEDYPTLWKHATSKTSDLSTDYKYARDVYKEELDAYMAFVTDICKKDEADQIRATLEVPKYHNGQMAETFARAELWDRIVENYRYDYTRKFRCEKREMGKLKIINGSGFLLIRAPEFSTWKILTYEQLQMIQDAAMSRHNLMSALHVGFHNGSENLPVLVDALIHWQEQCLKRYNNDGYELIKGPESIFKARLNSLTSGDILPYFLR